METKRTVLMFLSEVGVADAATVAAAFAMTPTGAASLLLRYHRHGTLRRWRASGQRRYEYELSDRGTEWLVWAGSG